MKNTEYLYYFFIPLLLQIFLLQEVHTFTGYTPYLFLAGIIFFPYPSKHFLYLILAFTAGLFVDIFYFTGGVFAVTSLSLAYFRIKIIQFFRPAHYERDKKTVPLRLSEIYISGFGWTFLAHLLLYFFNSFSIHFVLNHFMDIVFHTIITYFFILVYILLFVRRK